MPRRIIRAYEGEYYHVFNRGSRKLAIYLSQNAYQHFVDLVNKYSHEHRITIIAMCLMPNHFHLHIRVESGGDLTQFMKQVCGEFSKRMNKMQRRTGTLFEGRFKCKHVCNESYFRQLCRYIHLNPVQAGLAIDPGDWEYSNYLECMGHRKMINGDHDLVTSMFGGPVQYADFVRDSISSNLITDQQLLKDLGEMKLI